jgi:hypothetical protein
MRMARENTGWGYDRIAGALANFGHCWSDETVGNILRRHGMLRLRSEARRHRGRILSDFFTVEVLGWRSVVTDYVLFFIHLESPRVSVAGHQTAGSRVMEQFARSATRETWGYLHSCRYVAHDRDTKPFRFRPDARI